MPKHIHFFKAASRLGLYNKPNKSTEVNIGVEKDPDGILTHEFLRQLDTNYSLSHFEFPVPEEVPPESYMQAIAETSAGFAAQINGQIQPTHAQIVIGGDHSVAFPSILALLTRLPPTQTIGYIQFDSHGDLHRRDTSPSGNFHGMWARALTEGVGDVHVDSLVHRHLDPHNLMIYGNLDLEAEEEQYIKEMSIDVWSEDDLLQDLQFATDHLRAFISHYDHIHVSFDVDVFDREFVSATGTPAPDGLDPSHVFPLLEVLGKARSLSMDLVEVNPDKEGATSTIQIGQRVIETLFAI